MGSVIGVVRVPVVGVLCLSREWRKVFSFPEPSIDDWNAIVSMRSSAPIVRGDHNAMESFPDGQRGIIASRTKCLRLARCMSFYKFLEGRMLDEARKYSDNGIRHLLLDFSTDESFDVCETGMYWIERSLAESFKNACNGEFNIGVRSSDDNWAVDIACRFNYDAVFCIDSCNYLDVTLLRNRLTDGTTRSQPRLFGRIYSPSQLKEWSCFEGMECDLDGDEDMMDAVGKSVSEATGCTGVRIPVAGKYFQEIRRGEMRGDMTAWGARDYIIIDREVRKNDNCNGAIDDEKLSSLCSEIMKLQ